MSGEKSYLSMVDLVDVVKFLVSKKYHVPLEDIVELNGRRAYSPLNGRRAYFHETLDNFYFKCPLVGHFEHTASFKISKKNSSYICYGCFRQGDIDKFIHEIIFEPFDFKTREEFFSSVLKFKDYNNPNQKNFFDLLNQ